MFGMTMMSSSMSSLSEVPGFMALFDALSNPFLGILFGAAMAAIMQSSSSSVGVIQALAMAGGIAFNSVIPIIMGINVGQVVPVLLASMGTSKDARRAAVIDLYLNVAGIVVFLPVYMILKATGHFPFDAVLATPVTIAICHTGYKLLTSVVELPAYRFYEKLGRLTIKEGESQKNILLDERFMSTPSLALAQCRQRVGECIKATNDSYQETVTLLDAWDPEIARRAHRAEELADWYQDEIDAYLAKLSVRSMTERESLELSYLMHVIADYENITDHVYHIVVTLNRFWESGAVFNETAKSEMQQLTEMTRKILRLAEESFYESDSRLTFRVIAMDRRLMKACEKARESQMARLISGETSVEGGTAFTDLLLDFERISDHLSKQARLSLVEGSKKQGDDAKRFLSILLDQEADEEDKLKRDLAIKA